MSTEKIKAKMQQKLEKAKKRLEKADFRKLDAEDKYDTAKSKLEMARDEYDEAEELLEEIKRECKSLGFDFEKEERDKLFHDPDYLKDDFLHDFVCASMFCDTNNYCPDDVFITNNQLYAYDGRKGIEIINPNIPDNLKNKSFQWDTRKDFEQVAGNNNRPTHVAEFIKLNLAKTQNCQNFKRGELEYLMLGDGKLEEKDGASIFKLGDKKFVVKKKHLEVFFEAIKDRDDALTVFWGESRDPIIIALKNITIYLVTLKRVYGSWRYNN